ncbi:MAG: histidinol-phosphatase HisJ family protein [Gaiellales bacterium]
MIVDYHMHLRGPRDADGSEPLVLTADNAERFALVARARGVTEIGFTEHVYYFRQTAPVWHLPYHTQRCVHDLDAYVDAVLEARRRGHPVRLGIEVDYVGDRQDALAELLAPYPFDFILGSVHEVGDMDLDKQPGVWGHRSVEDVWRGYFDHLCELARSGHVDVMAHPDLPKIFGDRPAPEVVAELHERVPAALAEAGVAVEISTAGLRKPVGELYPDEAFLAACHRRGVPITTASDAHLAELVGHELPRAVELARRLGYETVSVFERRHRRQEPLG